MSDSEWSMHGHFSHRRAADATDSVAPAVPYGASV